MDDDAPTSPALTARDCAYQTVMRAFDSDDLTSLDTFTMQRAVRDLIASEDIASARCLNELYEMGIPIHYDESVWPEPLATFAARHWTNPVYVDVLATLVESGVDFDTTTSEYPVSGRSLVEDRAPGIFRLVEFKAHMVASGGSVNYPEFLL